MEPREFKNSRGHYAFHLATSVVFVATGAAMLLRAERGFDRAMGVVCIVCFGVAAVVIALAILDEKPQVRIDDSGVFASKLKEGTIAWSEIQGAYLKGKFLYLVRFGSLKISPIYVGGLDAGPREILEAIERRITSLARG